MPGLALGIKRKGLKQGLKHEMLNLKGPSQLKGGPTEEKKSPVWVMIWPENQYDQTVIPVL